MPVTLVEGVRRLGREGVRGDLGARADVEAVGEGISQGSELLGPLDGFACSTEAALAEACVLVLRVGLGAKVLRVGPGSFGFEEEQLGGSVGENRGAYKQVSFG